MSFIITDARRAVWDCIDNYDKTKDLYKTKFKLENDGSGMPIRAEPSISDLPGIRIEPETFNPEWWLNQQQKVPHVLNVSIWTPHWDICTAERYLELTNEAIWRYTDPNDGTVTRIKRVTGYHPVSAGVAWKRIELNEMNSVKTGMRTAVQVMLTEYKLTVFANRNPLTMQQG